MLGSLYSNSTTTISESALGDACIMRPCIHLSDLSVLGIGGRTMLGIDVDTLEAQRAGANTKLTANEVVAGEMQDKLITDVNQTLASAAIGTYPIYLPTAAHASRTTPLGPRVGG